MMRGFILFTLTMTVITTSVIMYEPQASMQDAYEASVQPVEVPYLDLTINQVREQQNGRTDKNVNDASHQDSGEAEHPAGENAVVSADEPDDDAGSAVPELVEPEADLGQSDEPDTGGAEDPILTYVGNWTISFYCPGPCCCGEWATGCTASGVLATEWHTVATDMFPFGTELYVDGLGYFVVEDLGVSGEWLDVFVNDHQEALNLGLQYRDVYVVGGEY